jgi:SAM-dependent methyltransferase
MTAPTTSFDFDRAYRAPFTLWGDIRIPTEVKALTRHGTPRSVLELGCGVGRFSHYLACQGLRATGVDFSPVAIGKARERRIPNAGGLEFLVGDVTHLDALNGPFDVSFDVGCFHCLDPQDQRAYAIQIARLLKPGGAHLIWALDSAPGGMALSPVAVKNIFAPAFELRNIQKSRRRLARSHWYWLIAAAEGDRALRRTRRNVVPAEQILR